MLSHHKYQCFQLIIEGEVESSLNLFVKLYLFFLLFLALLFVFLLVDGGLLPLGVDLGALSGLPHVKLWSLFLSLLGFPFIKGQSLGLVAYRLLKNKEINQLT